MALGFVKKIFSFGSRAVEEKPAEEAVAPHAATLAGGQPDIPPPPPEQPEPPSPVEEPVPNQPAETPPPDEPGPSERPDELPPGPNAPEPDETPDIPPSSPQEAPPGNVPVEEPAQDPPREIPPGPDEVPSYTPTEIPPGNSPAEFASGAGQQPAARARVVIGEARPAPAAATSAEPERRNWLSRLTEGLSRSSRQLSDNIAGVFTRRKLDDDTLEELEDILLQADLGIETAMRITDTLASGRYGREVSGEEVRGVMAAEVAKVLDPVARPLELDLSFRPHVVLVVGVNGTGKTTTIGKLAAKLRDAGLKVTLGAGDTFRAAAIEQLKIWADRTGSTFVGTKLGSDAAGLAFDAYKQARDNGSDVVIIDTAGRLQNKAELMEELAKIVRVLQKHDPEAPHTVLQTLDATTGQNALNQVEIFRNVAGVNGLVMTKLDGTARGGILVAISAKFKLPVYFIGIGEGVDDLEPFRAKDFADAIAGVPG